jgi:RNA polymerase sigma factor (sigma-70 family)
MPATRAAQPPSRGAKRATASDVEHNRVSQPILHRVAAGDSTAVQECLDRYGGFVWSLARRFSKQPSEAEDAAQEVFIELWRKAGRFDPSVASEMTFVAMIARRRLIDRNRRRQRGPTSELSGVELPSESADRDLAEVDICDEAARASRALTELKPDQRRVLELSIYSGLSHEQIARVTKLPLGTVKTHARRGLARVREMLGLAPAPKIEGGGT